MNIRHRAVCGILAVMALALGLFSMTQQVQAAEPWNTLVYYYVEVYGPPDPSLGGNQPLVASGDIPVAPSYQDMGAVYGPDMAGGGGYTVIRIEEDATTGIIIDVSFDSSGDFP